VAASFVHPPPVAQSALLPLVPQDAQEVRGVLAVAGAVLDLGGEVVVDRDDDLTVGVLGCEVVEADLGDDVGGEPVLAAGKVADELGAG
jgi:hypothetical protein